MGFWIKNKYVSYCSECGYVVEQETPYCPNCGKKTERNKDMDNKASSKSTSISTGDYITFEEEPIINRTYGWICPKCGRVNAPWLTVCPCYKPKKTYSTTYTINKDDLVFRTHTDTSVTK